MGHEGGQNLKRDEDGQLNSALKTISVDTTEQQTPPLPLASKSSWGNSLKRGLKRRIQRSHHTHYICALPHPSNGIDIEPQ